jgi:hypothetical protein
VLGYEYRIDVWVPHDQAEARVDVATWLDHD